MISNRIRIIGSTTFGAIVLALSLGITSQAANAEMTDPPPCIESPTGGCQNGPLGNGSGGGGWGPWVPGGALDGFSSGEWVGDASTSGWVFHKLDGEQASYYDAEVVRAGYELSSCVPYGPDVVCI